MILTKILIDRLMIIIKTMWTFAYVINMKIGKHAGKLGAFSRITSTRQFN